MKIMIENIATMFVLACVEAIAIISMLSSDPLPKSVVSEEHHNWVKHQCSRDDLSELEKTSCKNYYASNQQEKR